MSRNLDYGTLHMAAENLAALVDVADAGETAARILRRWSGESNPIATPRELLFIRSITESARRHAFRDAVDVATAGDALSKPRKRSLARAWALLCLRRLVEATSWSRNGTTSPNGENGAGGPR